ncbi:MAG: Inner rane transporter permease protein ycjP, partial [Bacillota bacterium]
MKLNKPMFSMSLKRRLFGMKLTDGLVYRMVLYALLIIIGFVYVYPLLHMLSYSLKSLADLLDPTINILPSSLYLENFTDALLVLNYVPLFFESLTVTLIPALLQTMVASLIGYGFARFQFPLKKVWFALLLATYLIPPQVTMIPRYVLFFNIGILETIFSIIIPATFGQGVSSAIFVLIFYQFYLMVPKALDEAAQLD